MGGLHERVSCIGREGANTVLKGVGLYGDEVVEVGGGGVA